MKKLILVCSICLIAFLANAQQNKVEKDFALYSQNMNNHVDEAFKVKNFVAAADTINLWLSRYDKLSPELKKDLEGYTVNAYYNLACVYSRQGKIIQGVDAFESSMNAGYTDYAHLLVDNDMDNLRGDNRFKADVLKLREKGDYGYILQKSGPYDNKTADLPGFTYQSASAPELVALKTKFNLDSVAGNGDEISRIKNILHWVHNEVRHDGNSGNPKSKNALDLITICQKENRGLNCRMMSTILRDAYQSEGFPTRIVTCLPKDTSDTDCHVITVVWSKTLNKWVWMDPTFNAYVTDDKGNLLNIEEVRERLISNQPLVLNDDANWNNKVKQTKDYYLGYYMSKNLYWLECATKNTWDLETRKPGMETISYINLYPGTFNTIHQVKKQFGDMVEYATNNPDYFWQKPASGE